MQQMQVQLGEGLAWLDHVFGKAERVEHNISELRQYYQKHMHDEPFYTPAVYVGAGKYERIVPDALEFPKADRKHIGLEIHSGQNRVVRRIFEKVGYKVVNLDRVSFAGLTKKNVGRGKWRFLTPKEVAFLQMGQF